MNDTQDFRNKVVSLFNKVNVKELDQDFRETFGVGLKEVNEYFTEQFKREQSPSSVSDAAVKSITSFKTHLGVITTYETRGSGILDYNKRQWVVRHLTDEGGLPTSTIWSVTNESGEVFTVGDEAHYVYSDGENRKPFVIGKFVLKDNGELTAYETNCPHKGGTCNVKDLRKPVPSWSFTTHDGEEIKDKKATVWHAYQGLSELYPTTAAYAKGLADVAIFSTKEKAREYVRLNTKDYSLQQHHDAVEKATKKINELYNLDRFREMAIIENFKHELLTALQNGTR